MTSISDFIKSIPDKPEPVRKRIFWILSGLAGIAVVTVWSASLKHQISGLNPKDVFSSGITTTSVTAPHYLSVNRTEIKDGKTLIYFSVQNDSADILNFSKISDIKLTITDKTFVPSQITNRQNQPFVAKVLSHSQNFGILQFNESLKSGKGSLTFDNLFFEQNQNSIFKEIVPVDLAKLQKPQTLRN